MAYAPTEWGNNAPNLTPELMNKLEQGIADHTEDTDNPHNVTKEQVGLDKVDNTSDADKPVSTATEELIDTTKDELTESTTKDMVELKMLGWTVPKDCPIQNSISGSTFIQNVGRVNLGRLLWGYASSAAQPFFYVDLPNVKIGSNKGYCSEYVLSESTTYGGMTDKGFRFALASENRSRVYVKDTAYTDATAIQIANKTTYLYYELATPVTKTIDGNEVVDKMTSMFGPLVKNFLKPNSVIYDEYGIGYVNITDDIEIGYKGFNGYYLTISGEVASDVSYKLCSNVRLRQLTMGKAVKFVGCPPTGGPDKYFFRIYNKYTKKTYYDYGEGVIIPIQNSSPQNCDIYLEIKAGTPTTVEDVFYPVLSNDLSIDYTIGDVPYLGVQETLIEDLSVIWEDAQKGYDAYDMATDAQTIANNNSNEISSIKNTLNKTTIDVGRLADSTTGEYSTAEGRNTTASGNSSHAEGLNTTASGDYGSHAEGFSTIASGWYSHAEGQSTTASGDYGSHAEGDWSKAFGEASHAEGLSTIASGDYGSHAEGLSTRATGESQHVQGKYNVEDTENKYAHIVGGGDDTKRKNIHTLDWDGNAEYAGDVISTDTDGNKTSLNGLVTRLELSKTSGNLAKVQVDFLNVGNKKIVLQGQVSGKVGTYFSVTNSNEESFSITVDDTTVVPEPITKLLYSSQGTFRSKIVGSISISNAVASDGAKSITATVTFNGSYSFTSANVRSDMVYFHF